MLRTSIDSEVRALREIYLFSIDYIEAFERFKYVDIRVVTNSKKCIYMVKSFKLVKNEAWAITNPIQKQWKCGFVKVY